MNLIYAFLLMPQFFTKLQVQFFENLFLPRAKNKGVEETMICFIKIQSENMKMTWNIGLFSYIFYDLQFWCNVIKMWWIYCFVNNFYQIVWY